MPYLLVIISGLLMTVSFAPFNIYPAGFIALFPVFYLFEKYSFSYKTAFLYALILGATVSIAAFHWIIHTVMVFGMMPAVPAALIFAGYIFISNSKYYIFFLGMQLYRQRLHPHKRSEIINALIITVIWAVAEKFGWELFPYYGSNLVSADTYFIQNVDLIGTPGLSIIWFFISYALYRLTVLTVSYFNEKPATGLFKPLLRSPVVITGLLLLVMTHTYGLIISEHYIKERENLKTEHIGVPQGNTPLGYDYYRNYYSALRNNTEKMTRLTLKMMKEASAENRRPSLVVWPESATPFLSYLETAFFRKSILDMLKEEPVELIINDILEDRKDNKSYSNLFLLEKNGLPVNNYQKVFLLPFGEFLPFGETFPELKRMFPQVSDYDAGSRFELLNATAGYLMPLICYEVIPSWFSADFHRMTDYRSQIMINITNDAWFGDSIESSQHLALASLRSVELRLPMIRAANSGITAYIDRLGRVHNPTGLFTTETVIYDVKVPPSEGEPATLYACWGEWPRNLLITAGLLLVILTVYRTRASSSIDEESNVTRSIP